MVWTVLYTGRGWSLVAGFCKHGSDILSFIKCRKTLKNRGTTSIPRRNMFRWVIGIYKIVWNSSLGLKFCLQLLLLLFITITIIIQCKVTLCRIIHYAMKHKQVWRYGSTLAYRPYYVKADGQLHAPVTLPIVKRPRWGCINLKIGRETIERNTYFVRAGTRDRISQFQC
jgi:hypothetical protein